MDDSKLIRDFELILQNQRKRSSDLYKNVVNTQKNTTYKPMDVVSTVYSQIKSMQMADTRNLSSDRNTNVKFLSVDKAPMYKAPNTTKFETQCVSDTQLIKLAEGVEAIDAYTGVTQEFDTTFVNTKADTDSHSEKLSQIISNDRDINKTDISESNLSEDIGCDREHEGRSLFQSNNNGSKELESQLANNEVHNSENDVLRQILSSPSNTSNKKEFDANLAYRKATNIENKAVPQSNTCKIKEYDSGISKDVNNADHEVLSQILPTKSKFVRKDLAKTKIDKKFEVFKSILGEKVNERQILNDKLKTTNVIGEIDGKVEIFPFNKEFHLQNKHVETSELEKTDKCLRDNIGLCDDFSIFEENDDTFIKSQILPCNLHPIHKNKKRKEKRKINQSKKPDIAIQSQIQITEDFNNFIEPELKQKNNNIVDTEIKNTTQTNERIEISKVNLITEQNHNSKEQSNGNEDYHCKDESKSTQDDEVMEIIRLDSNTKSSSNESTSILRNVDVKILPNSQDLFESKKNFDIEIDSVKQRSISPVLNRPVKRKMSSFVVDLETFEQFERIAIPIIQHDFDTTIVQQIINSQIIDKELILNANIERNDSPVLEYQCDQLKLNSSDLNKQINNNCNSNMEVKAKMDVPIDEILFSSDEEIETNTKLDLPLTVPLNNLDSSLEDIFDEPDHTMFVGFQTASNKSIQICTDSFEKAKGILEAVEDNKELSLTELVEKYDNAKRSAKKIKADKASHPKESSITRSKHLSAEIKESINDYKTNVFQGFTTASNKKINMSSKAMEMCKNVFKDIDLNEKFVSNEDLNKGDINDNVCQKIETMDEVMDENFEKLLLKELDNIETSLEEKKVTVNSNLEEKADNNTNTATKDNNLRIKDEMRSKKSDKDSKRSIQYKTKSPKSFHHIENWLQDCDFEIVLEDSKEKSRKIDGNPKFVQKSTAKSPVRFKSSRLMKIFENVQKNEEEEAKKAFFCEIKTNNKNIEKSKTKKALEDIDIKTDASNKYENIDIRKDFVGFKTANNAVIQISEASLSKTKEVFKDIEQQFPESKNHIEMADFRNQKGNDDKTQTCKENLSPVKDMKTSALSDTKNIKVIYEKLKNLDVSMFQGFKTASNKNVILSEQALIKSKQLFKDIDYNLENEMNTKRKEQKIFQRVDENTTGRLFKTASEKPVKVSIDALENSKKIFENIEIGNENLTGKEVDKIKVSPKNLEVRDFQTFVGFKTASNKKVAICEKALAKSKKIFEDIDGSAELENKNFDKSITQFKGFTTASNKNIEISKECLAKAKKLLDTVEPNIDRNNQKFDLLSHVFKGFQTASNKTVRISDEALAKSKKLFEVVDVETTIDQNKQNLDVISEMGGFKGFQTASNKEVSISKDALAKTLKIFENMDLEVNINPKDNMFVKPSNTVKAFQTDNNEKAKIIKDAKANNSFADITPPRNDGKNTIDAAEITPNEMELGVENQVKNNEIQANMDNINTQNLNSKSSLHTDCVVNPNKRSGSPILSCPKAKRKKFETPYSTQTKILPNIQEENVTNNVDLIKFTENYKKVKKFTLKDLLDKDITAKIDPYIANFNLDNILDFQFDKERNDVIKADEKLTIKEIKASFTEATNKRLIPNGWLDNHLKLILWKLLSYEIKFPSLGKVCTVRNVMDQLKYRYDIELFNAERPILRKIFEKDEVSTNCIVFCVAGIFVDGVSVTSVTNQTNIELQLTDGWYFIMATIDKMLSKLVYDKKITVGSKIITEGAELINCEQGVSPWEDTSTVRLAISGNSTRPASWDSKLGLRRTRLRSTLASVKAEGGRVRRLEIYVTRLYPLLYVEKFEDGSTVTRSERLEHLYQMKYEAEREAMIEKIYEEVAKEFEKDSQDSEESCGSNKRKSCESGSQIAKTMKRSRDPMEFRAQMTSSQIQILQDHTNKTRDKYIQAVQDRVRNLGNRQYVTLARARIVGLQRNGEKVSVTKGMLSVWKPNDEILEMMKEGNWIEVLNAVPTGIRNSEIQISTGRQSVFRKITKEEKLFEPHLQMLKRICYNIKDVSQNPSLITEYNEIDTVGLIFSIEPTNQEFESKKTQFQNVYLADIDKNMICVNFWGGIKKFGFENALETEQVIFCANLQKRSGNTRRNVPQYRATEFSIFTKSPKNPKAREMVEEFNKRMHGLDRRRFCEDCVAIKQNYSVLKCFDSENVSPYRFHNNSAYNLGKHKMLIETPKNVKKEEFDLTGLDFESSFRQPETQELSPRTLRKKQVQEKIGKLKMYGEPPPLSSINIVNISKNAANSYKSPLLKNDSVAPNKNDSDTNVTTPKKVPNINAKSLERSPIIPVTRTVKRVNPVKLNFGNVDKNDTDNFAEDFDVSPPLSLD